jgi:hypothetical protein
MKTYDNMKLKLVWSNPVCLEKRGKHGRARTILEWFLVIVYIIMVMSVLVLSCTRGSEAADWVSIGPEGTTSEHIGTGSTVLFSDNAGDVYAKYSSGWSNVDLNASANCVCADQVSGKHFVGTAFDGWVEYGGSFVRAFDAGGVDSCAIQNGAVILLASNGQAYKHSTGLSQNDWYEGWEVQAWGFTPEKLAVDSSARLFSASATRLYREATIGAGDFIDIGEIQASAGSAGPKKIAFRGTTIFVLRNNGTIRKFAWNGSSYTMSQLAFTGVMDIASDNLRLYFVQSAGIFKTSDDVNVTALSPAPADELAVERLSDGTLRCGTNGSGLYDLNLLPAATVQTLTTTSTTFTLTWPAVTGASGYKVYVCSDFGACVFTDLGLTRTYTALKTGVRLVYAVAYDADGYESTVGYKTVCNSADTLRPPAIADLQWSASTTTIWVWFRLTGDQAGTGSFLASAEVALSTALSSRNWTASVKQVFMPPGAVGTYVSAVITGLTPDTAYQVGAAQRDTCGIGALTIVNARTLPAGTPGTVTLAWDANTQPDVTGYKVYYGLESGVYTASQNVGNVTTTQILVERGVRVYFVATCYTSTGTESGYSNQVSTVVPQ